MVSAAARSQILRCIKAETRGAAARHAREKAIAGGRDRRFDMRDDRGDLDGRRCEVVAQVVEPEREIVRRRACERLGFAPCRCACATILKICAVGTLDARVDQHQRERRQFGRGSSEFRRCPT